LEAIPGIGLYDVIALWHVLEHLINPWSTLHELAGKLQPGGIIVIAAKSSSLTIPHI
jgi:2-polyprenyl-3-methyl-5-hydroxy-6-metoxy-1,4-benzoquinol methylase